MVQPNSFNTEFRGGVIGLMAPPKSAKTSWGMTAPKTILHFDTDRGMERAAPRLMAQGVTIKQLEANKVPSYEDMQGADIISIPYEKPLSWPGQRLSGYNEIVKNIVTTVQMACMADWVKTIFYDTGTIVWPWIHSAELEMKQITNASRESLISVEYANPNAIQKSLFVNPASTGKNVVVSHHMRQIRDDNMKIIGETWDGWSKMEQTVDVFVHTRIEPELIVGRGPTPVAKVVRCGWSLGAESKDTPEFSFDGLVAFVNSTRGF
jgi:hypothetical protein